MQFVRSDLLSHCGEDHAMALDQAFTRKCIAYYRCLKMSAIAGNGHLCTRNTRFDQIFDLFIFHDLEFSGCQEAHIRPAFLG